MTPAPGPLAGLRVVELAGLGPVAHAAMLLADLGADVVRVERPPTAGSSGGLGGTGPSDPLLRGRRLLSLDISAAAGRAALLDLVAAADVLIEGFRPGVAERLGVGPDDCVARNERLVYGRVSTWGREGPLRDSPGHDINVLSVTGALRAMGEPDRPPQPPLSLVSVFGGGSMLLLVGILAALLERASSGRGQVVDAALLDGAALLSQWNLGMRAHGLWSDDRGSNLVDGSVPYYSTYRCADGEYVAVGAIEPAFFHAMAEGLGLRAEELGAQQDRAGWPRMRDVLAQTFAGRTRDEWAQHFADRDACVTPVLSYGEAPTFSQIAARSTYSVEDGAIAAAPAPRFSRNQQRAGGPALPVGLDDLVSQWSPRSGGDRPLGADGQETPPV